MYNKNMDLLNILLIIQTLVITLISIIFIFVFENKRDMDKMKKVIIFQTKGNWLILLSLVFLFIITLADEESLYFLILSIFLVSISASWTLYLIWKATRIITLNSEYKKEKELYTEWLHRRINKVSSKSKKKIEKNRKEIEQEISNIKWIEVKEYFLLSDNYKKLTEFNLDDRISSKLFTINSKAIDNIDEGVFKHRMFGDKDVKNIEDDDKKVIDINLNNENYFNDKNKIIFNKDDFNFYISNSFYDLRRDFFDDILDIQSIFEVIKEIKESKREKEWNERLEEILDIHSYVYNIDDPNNITYLLENIRIKEKLKVFRSDLSDFIIFQEFLEKSNSQNNRRDIVSFAYDNLMNAVEKDNKSKFSDYMKLYTFYFYNFSKKFNSILFFDRSWRGLKGILEKEYYFKNNESIFDEKKYIKYSELALKEFNGLLKKVYEEGDIESYKIYLDNLFNKMKDVYRYKYKSNGEPYNFLENNRQEMVFGLASFIYWENKKSFKEHEFFNETIKYLGRSFNNINDYFFLLDRAIELEWDREKKWGWDWWKIEKYTDRGVQRGRIGKDGFCFFTWFILNKFKGDFDINKISKNLLISKNIDSYIKEIKEYSDSINVENKDSKEKLIKFCKKWEENKEKHWNELVDTQELDKEKVNKELNIIKDGWVEDKEFLDKFFKLKDLSNKDNFEQQTRFGSEYFDLKERFVKGDFNEHIMWMGNGKIELSSGILRDVFKIMISLNKLIKVNSLDDFDNKIKKIDKKQIKDCIIFLDNDIRKDFIYNKDYSHKDKIKQDRRRKDDFYHYEYDNDIEIPIYFTYKSNGEVCLLNKNKIGSIDFYNPKNSSHEEGKVFEELFVNITDKIDKEKIKWDEGTKESEKNDLLANKVLVKIFLKWEWKDKTEENEEIGFYFKK